MSDSYHHGDLRRALLDEAASLLIAEGVAALSLREVARRIGVSPTAPYHHFKSKADLMCALAEDVLNDLDDALREADAHGTSPVDRLRQQGIAYVLFAVDNPERFRLAFRPESGDPFSAMTSGESPPPEDVTAFRHLLRAVRDEVTDSAAQAALAVAAWSLVHGLASLLVDGPLRAIASDRRRVRVLAESTVAHLRVDLSGEKR